METVYETVLQIHLEELETHLLFLQDRIKSYGEDELKNLDEAVVNLNATIINNLKGRQL
jgi:hypothetical protein